MPCLQDGVTYTGYSQGELLKRVKEVGKETSELVFVLLQDDAAKTEVDSLIKFKPN